MIPFILAGTGMALVFAPTANAVLDAVRPEEAGQASGATNAIREVGGDAGRRRAGLGVRRQRLLRVAAGVHRRHDERRWVGAAVLAAGALVALLVPGKRRAPSAQVGRAGPVAAS